jgi:pyruvate/2-oxoglutarate/acetoin dehydrogenase E1 component
MRDMKYRQAINEAIDEELERDQSVFVLGEDVGKGSGIFGRHRGLFDKYGSDRFKDTPISETAIMGAAIGAAVTGMRPIVDFMFTDFLGVAMDEIWNQLTKMRYMYGGKAKMPVTITCVSGAGLSGATQHSKCAEGFLMSIPGLKIVSPSTPYDAKGLVKSAIRDDNPVIVFVHKVLMLDPTTGHVPEGEYTIPLGKADIKRTGNQVTVVAIGLMVHRALAAAVTLEKQNISIEVIDPRTTVPLDKETIINSVKKTGRLVIMDEEPKTGSAAAEIAAIIAEDAFDYLDAPIKRVCAPDTPIPFSPVLEKLWMPNEEKLIKTIKEII